MPLSIRGKPFYTKEQLERAKACSALEYARSRGYNLVANGPGRYFLREHDSMIFLSDGRWYWNSRHKKGRALDFLLVYECKSMMEAVLILTNDPALGGNHSPMNYHAKLEPPTPPKVFTLPDRANTSRQLFAYLCSTRCLDREILLSLIREGRLYQSVVQRNEKNIYNAVFVGLDNRGTPRNAFQRGITDKSTFKNGVEGSDKTWPFLLPGEAISDTLAVFEGAIDAISHATIAKAEGGEWRQHTRMAVGGNFPIEAITKYLDLHPKVSNLALALDNDETGRLLADYITAGLAGRQLTFLSLQQPVGKDWSQYLTDYWREEKQKKMK